MILTRKPVRPQKADFRDQNFVIQATKFRVCEDSSAGMCLPVGRELRDAFGARNILPDQSGRPA